MDDKTKELLQDHNRIARAFSAERHGHQPCNGCDDPIEPWWNYCAMCGYHIAANG